MSKIVAGLQATGISAAARSTHGERRNELDILWSAARLTDQIWLMPAEASPHTRSGLRDLGALQDEAQHVFPLGSRVRIAIECDRDANLLLLNKGTSGKLYCLCPSVFAPQQRIQRGLNTLPHAQSPYQNFAVTGASGREHLLAILSEKPIGTEWMPSSPGVAPALVLGDNEVNDLVRTLRETPADRWMALATYFEIAAK